MPEVRGDIIPPGRVRMIFASIIVLLTIVTVWKVIDYRTQPPPPPHPIGEIQPSDG